MIKNTHILWDNKNTVMGIGLLLFIMLQMSLALGSSFSFASSQKMIDTLNQLSLKMDTIEDKHQNYLIGLTSVEDVSTIIVKERFNLFTTITTQ